MPLQYADEAKQPGEVLIYSMTWTAGESMATGDSLSGSPTAVIATYPEGVAMSSTMIKVGGEASLTDNTVYVTIILGTSGQLYKITFGAVTTNGETVQEDLILQVMEY